MRKTPYLDLCDEAARTEKSILGLEFVVLTRYISCGFNCQQSFGDCYGNDVLVPNLAVCVGDAYQRDKTVEEMYLSIWQIWWSRLLENWLDFFWWYGLSVDLTMLLI